jgi:acid phosphatase
MTDDGHDTNVTFASSWERNFLEPLLNNSYFMNDTLILLTFDEDETYTSHNTIFSILLGGAIPENLKGTTDNTFYTHYSTISSISANWGLPTLGRWDAGANVFQVVANKTGYQNAANVNTSNIYLNQSYPGPVSDSLYIPIWPAPDTLNAKGAAGVGVLASVKSIWGSSSGTYNYTNVYPYDLPAGINAGGTPVSGVSNSTGTGSSPAATSSKSGGLSTGAKAGIGVGVALGVLLVLAGVLLLLWRRRRGKGEKEVNSARGVNQEQWTKPELPGEDVKRELPTDGTHQVHKMDGNSLPVEIGER